MEPQVGVPAAGREALRMSEERFRLLVESVRDYAIFMLDPFGRVASWNLGAERIKGYRAEEILGRHVTTFYPEEDVAADKLRWALETAVAQGRVEDEGWRVRKDGSRFWASVVITALHDDAGDLVGFAKVTRDLTERRRSEDERLRLAREQAARSEAEALHRRTALLAEVSRLLANAIGDELPLQQVAELIVPAAADVCLVQLIELSPAGAALQLRTAAAAHVEPDRAGRLRGLAPEAYDPEGAHPVAAAIRDGRIGLRSAETSRPDGCPAFEAAGISDVVIAPLFARGRALGVLCLGFGVREGEKSGIGDELFADQLGGRIGVAVDNARLFREAHAAAEVAREAAAAREAFLARASHELRTPLTSALGTVRMLAKDGSLLDERLRPLLAVADRSLAQMARLVDDLLDVSKLRSDEETLVRESVDLAAAVRDSVEIVAAPAGEKGVELRASVPAGLELDADPAKLGQLLVNLLANGVKFTPRGGEVRVEARRGDGEVELRVRDTGEGIAAEHLERVFEPFFQVRPATRGRPRGTGLGLAICRQIVTLHGGRVWAESGGPGRGSTFVVRLPVTGDRRAGDPAIG